MLTWTMGRVGARNAGRRTLLWGGAAALMAASLVSPTLAATYYATNEADLRAYVTLANGDGDPSSKIVMTTNFEIVGTSNLPSVTKPLTIDTNGFTLSSATSASILFQAGGSQPVTLVGTFTHANIASNVTSASAVVVRGSASVINNGIIQAGSNSLGAGNIGVEFNVIGGAPTFVNNGTVQGGNGATVGGYGLYVRNGTNPIINNGTIEGGNGTAAVGISGFASSAALINSGTIRAGIGQATAIGWLNSIVPSTITGTITLELQAGSVIVGNVVANPNAGPIDIFRLGGTTNSTFDVSTIGPQYQNFDTLQKTGTSTWALTGTGTHTRPWEIVVGTLQIGNGGTSGSIVSNVTNNATLAFNRSDTLTYGGVVSGTGVLNRSAPARRSSPAPTAIPAPPTCRPARLLSTATRPARPGSPACSPAPGSAAPALSAAT